MLAHVSIRAHFGSNGWRWRDDEKVLRAGGGRTGVRGGGSRAGAAADDVDGGRSGTRGTGIRTAGAAGECAGCVRLARAWRPNAGRGEPVSYPENLAGRRGGVSAGAAERQPDRSAGGQTRLAAPARRARGSRFEVLRRDDGDAAAEVPGRHTARLYGGVFEWSVFLIRAVGIEAGGTGGRGSMCGESVGGGKPARTEAAGAGGRQARSAGEARRSEEDGGDGAQAGRRERGGPELRGAMHRLFVVQRGAGGVHDPRRRACLSGRRSRADGGIFPQA